MLDKFTQRLMDSLHRSMRQTVIPVKEAIKKNINMQIDIGTMLLKFGTMILLLIGMTKETKSDSQQKKIAPPNTIIINNYLNGKRIEDGDNSDGI